MLPTPENATHGGPVLSEGEEHMGESGSAREARQAELDEVIRMGTNIEQLIQELCPNGVPYVALGDFAEIQRGSGMPKSILIEEGVGAIHYGQIYTLYGTYADSTFTFVSEEDAQKLVHVNPGDLIITNTSENLEDVGKSLAWVGDKQVVIGGHACVIRHKHSSKYLAYWMQTEDFQQQKRKLCTGTKVIELSTKKLAQIMVPLPPVEVQEEIVRILDMFTVLEAELEAELEKRRMQYAHYRDALLSFNNLSSFERERESLRPGSLRSGG